MLLRTVWISQCGCQYGWNTVAEVAHFLFLPLCDFTIGLFWYAEPGIRWNFFPSIVEYLLSFILFVTGTGTWLLVLYHVWVSFDTLFVLCHVRVSFDTLFVLCHVWVSFDTLFVMLCACTDMYLKTAEVSLRKSRLGQIVFRIYSVEQLLLYCDFRDFYLLQSPPSLR